MIKQLSIFDIPVNPTKEIAVKNEKVDLKPAAVIKQKIHKESSLMSLTTLMHQRFGITRYSKITVTANETLYTLFRKLAFYIYRNGDWKDEDYEQTAAIIGNLTYYGYLSDHDNESISSAKAVSEADNPFLKAHKKLYQGEKDFTLQTASNYEKLRFLRVTDETCGNTYTGQVRYFRDIPTFTFGYVNRKKLIGYGKLVLAIKNAYDEQQPSFERETLNELLHQLFAYRYSNKKYAFLFEKSPLPDTYAELLQNHDISRKEWQETVQRNRAIDFIRNFVFDNYNIVASQRYEDAITRKTRARAWQTKKHINYDTSLLMNHSSLLNSFSKLELDNDVDYHAFHEFEHEVNRVLNVLPGGLNKPALRLRRLGNYHAMGMYIPAVNNIVIDFRGPEDSEIFMPTAGFHSFIHEYGHFLDYQSQSCQISLQPEFTNIVNRYREHIIHSDVTLDKPEYYCTPTEVFARCFERYMDNAGLQTALLDKHSTYETSPEYQAIDSQMMKDAIKIFDRLFPEIRRNLEDIQNKL